ncbi:MAG TPA: twin-arginine translocase TatA/TatE family subunit [Gemmatimonadales bacterium]
MLADLSIWHILILVVIIMLLFGSKRIPEIGRSIGKGINEFKAGLREVGSSSEELPPPPPAPQSEQRNVPPATSGAPKRLSQ